MNFTDEKYYNDFTIKSYESILQAAKSNYIFANYNNYKDFDNFIILRHDVDFSLEYSLKLAEIENNLDIKSNYFIWLQSDFYNAFEKRSQIIIKNIQNLGHSINIHFDFNFYDIKTEVNIEKYLNVEIKIFQDLFGITPLAFSFHNPNKFSLNFNKDKYANLINTYANDFFNDIGYCSDSNGYWRYERLEDVIKSKKYNKLQILTHPGWWQEDVKSPRERILNIVNQRSKNIIDYYDKFLEDNGRENVK